MGHSLFWTFVFLLHTASNTPSTSSAERSTMRTRCCPHTDSSAAQKLKHLIWTLKLRLFGRHKWSHCMQMLSTEAYDPSSAGQWLVWEKSLAMQSHGALILLFTVTDWKKKKVDKCLRKWFFGCALFQTTADGKSPSFLAVLSDVAAEKKRQFVLSVFSLFTVASELLSEEITHTSIQSRLQIWYWCFCFVFLIELDKNFVMIICRSLHSFSDCYLQWVTRWS